MKLRTRLVAATALIPLAFAAAGCSLLKPTLSADQVEAEIKTQLASQANINADDVSCPDDLKGEVGQTMTCSVTAAGKTIQVNVTVTSVEGRTIKFDIKES